jgi:hypothetical protein
VLLAVCRPVPTPPSRTHLKPRFMLARACPHAGHWFLFFSIQGPLLLLEALLGEARRAAGLHLPRPLRIATTVGVLHICERHAC